MFNLLPLRKSILFNLVFYRTTALSNLVLRVILIGNNTDTGITLSELISNAV